MASIQLNSVSVDFPIYNLSARSLKKQFIKITTGGKFNYNNKILCIKALNNVDLSIKKGDRIGLIGKNGSGKSTLLRVLANIYEPTQGKIICEGKISPLLDVMLGINTETTGYENIVLRCLLLGLNQKEIQKKINQIIDFTELDDYLYAPIRTYSTGMQLRLAFAVATCIDPDILVMDEIIATGDEKFIQKAQIRLENFIDHANIVVLASHSDATIKHFCNKVILMDNGNIKYFGNVQEGLDRYYNKS